MMSSRIQMMVTMYSGRILFSSKMITRPGFDELSATESYLAVVEPGKSGG
jgi:hypothetical protein